MINFSQSDPDSDTDSEQMSKGFVATKNWGKIKVLAIIFRNIGVQ